MFKHRMIICIIVLLTYPVLSYTYVPCNEISREFKFPCRCTLDPKERDSSGHPSIYVDCDRVVFPRDLFSLPYGAPIVSYSQRWTGHITALRQVFSSTSLPMMRSIDLSKNSIRKLEESLISGFRSSLVELNLADNLLGDTLNPIFSSKEFHDLSQLQKLDLSGNKIRAIEEGIFEGCSNLTEIYLERNNMVSIPRSSLSGPISLKILSLKNNRIRNLKHETISSFQLNLEELYLDSNFISIIDDGTFSGMNKLKRLGLGRNKFKQFNSGVFEGMENVLEVDLSENFFAKFPIEALSSLKQLLHLNLSSNIIQSIQPYDIGPLESLTVLDLSRNNIADILPGTFSELKKLKKLDISVNSLRTIEDYTFEGLDELEELSLKDNNILLIPASALKRLTKLTLLRLDFNRIAALSADILSSITSKVTKLVISKNVIRELPQGSFQYFNKLETLDLSRNLIRNLNSDSFLGLKDSLTHLDLSQNKISALSGDTSSLGNLEVLNLSDNNITHLSPNMFTSLLSLSYLNLSYNKLELFSSESIQKLVLLENIDLSFTSLRALPPSSFKKINFLKNINLSHNFISEISSDVFSSLPNLTIIDLSHNSISNIKHNAFVNIMNIKHLILKNNNLSSFKGEIFNTGTSLENLDISNNVLTHLYPSSFRIHPRLREIHASNNNLGSFPAELVASLQFLEFIDLSKNFLQTIDDLNFAELPRLRALSLSHNLIEFVSEMSFHNSTQLQVLDLSHNKLDGFGERTFEGLVRLNELNIGENQFSELTERLFLPSRIEILENIIMTKNKFKVSPLRNLKKYSVSISTVDLSYNEIQDISREDDIMVSSKTLDFSFNPLSKKSIANILREPKTVRNLNLAGTEIDQLLRIEAPFLVNLNLSFNNITKLPQEAFVRTTLLETLDLSNNLIRNVAELQLHSLSSLRTLNISNNPILMISADDFKNFGFSLRTLSIYSLPECIKLEKGAFEQFVNLKRLDAYGYPRIGYLDIIGLLQKVTSVEQINIEIKDDVIGSDEFSPIIHPRLIELGITGTRLKSISSGTFSGLKREFIRIKIRNTSITTLPPALFFAIPKSSKIELDITGNELSTLSASFLSSVDDRRRDLRISGLEYNPITCDCGAEALRKWLPSHMIEVKCSKPDYLAGKYLTEIDTNELTCNPLKKTSTPADFYSKSITMSSKDEFETRTTELDIIWSVKPTEKVKPKMKPALISQFVLSNEDTLLISLIGGLILFVVILIIIFCIVRLRISSQRNKNRPAVTLMGQTMAPGSSCACSLKEIPTLYSLPPSYATLPYKVQGLSDSSFLRPSNYSTMGRIPYQHNTSAYSVSNLLEEEKIYR